MVNRRRKKTSKTHAPEMKDSLIENADGSERRLLGKQNRQTKTDRQKTREGKRMVS